MWRFATTTGQVSGVLRLFAGATSIPASGTVTEVSAISSLGSTSEVLF